MGCMMGFAIDTSASRMNESDSEDTTSPGLHFVGGVAGLALQVNQRGARSWVLRVQVGDKRRDMRLGGFPDVSLASAREAAREARAKVHFPSGRDALPCRKHPNF